MLQMWPNKKEVKEKEKAWAITYQLIKDAIKAINENRESLKLLESWEILDLHHAINNMGYSCVKTESLKDFYEVKEFCEQKNYSLFNLFFE